MTRSECQQPYSGFFKPRPNLPGLLQRSGTIRRRTTTLPDIWTDWCSVTGASAGGIDEATLLLFSRQVQPSRAVLSQLRRRLAPEEPAAPAWPRRHREDTGSLQG